MSLKAGTLTIVIVTLLYAAAGCEQSAVEQVQAAAAVAAARGADTDLGSSAEITLCRKIGRKSGRRIGIGREFFMADDSAVHGLIDFRDVDLDRVHAVHLVWLQPGGKELFRKYAEVVVSRNGDDLVATIAWRDAEDLHKLKLESQVVTAPGFTLKSSLDISRGKQRAPGAYTLRVYLHRKLMLERAFSVAEA